MPYSAGIAVFDSERKFIGNYLDQRIFESRVRPGQNDWVAIPGDEASVGRRFTFTAGHIPGTLSSSIQRPLEPGTYYVQAVYYNAFIGLSRPADKLFEPRETSAMMEHFDTGELFRSNIVEITLLPREGPD